jgi:hypothetical protein
MSAGTLSDLGRTQGDVNRLEEPLQGFPHFSLALGLHWYWLLLRSHVISLPKPRNRDFARGPRNAKTPTRTGV